MLFGAWKNFSVPSLNELANQLYNRKIAARNLTKIMEFATYIAYF